MTCPWHGSQFELVSGVPTRGPASIPQPVYENRVVAEKLALRRKERRALRLRAVWPPTFPHQQIATVNITPVVIRGVWLKEEPEAPP